MAVNWSLSQVIAQLDSGEQWFTNTITYAFPTTYTATYYGDGEDGGFRSVPFSLQPEFILAIETWNDLIPQSFQQTSSSSSDIEFAFTNTGIDYAHAYYPSTGSAWFETGSDVAYAEPGSYGFST